MLFWKQALFQRFQQGFKHATTPHKTIVSVSSQHSVRLLTTLTLILIPLHIFTTLGLFAVYGFPAQAWRLTLFMTVVTLAVYILSRTRYGERAINVFVLEMVILAIALLYINADAYSAVTAILPIYIASLFRSFKRLTITTIVTILSVYIISQTLPGDWEQIYGVLILLIVVGAVIIVRSKVQWVLEVQIHQRNEQLTESEARFRAAINAGRSLFALLQVVINTDGSVSDFIVVDANSRIADFVEQSYENLIGESVVNVLPAPLLKHLLPQFQRLLDQQLPILFGTISVEDIWWEYQLVPVSDGLALSLDDITSRKEADMREIELQREREQAIVLRKFITDVSHDIMTPLSIINTKAYLAGQSSDPDQRSSHLGEVNAQVFRLRDMIEQMLSQSRLYQLNPQDLDLHSINLNEVLEKLVEKFRNDEQYTPHHLVYQAVQPQAICTVDRVRLEIAISNLIENALKYTPETSTIIISCQTIDKGITIDVSDEGYGIPASELPNIFDPFYRIEEHRPQNAGSGLGLSITKRIVELHQGTITAESRPTGGMLFRIYLPLSG